MSDLVSEPGWIAPALAAELPGLELECLELEVAPQRSPAPVRERLEELASRITGGHVVHMRQDTVPWAYRVLWRRVGLDPDAERTPVEQLMLDRLVIGGLPSQGQPDDALVIATLETGVPLVAFDAERVEGRIGLRPTVADESLGEGGEKSPEGRIVYCDEQRPLASLTGEVAESAAVTRDTRRMVLCALVAEGVPRLSVEEALWIVSDMLASNPR